MIYALIIDGRVAETFADVDENGVELSRRFHPDFIAQLVPFDPEAPPESEPVPPAVPRQVTMRQARLALLRAGRLQEVDDAITSLPSPQKEAAQIEWQFAATVDRDSEFFKEMADALALDETSLDDLFAAAALL
jgi:hypothetical protein